MVDKFARRQVRETVRNVKAHIVERESSAEKFRAAHDFDAQNICRAGKVQRAFVDVHSDIVRAVDVSVIS